MKQLLRALRRPRSYRWWALRPWRRHSLVLALGGLIYVGIGSAYLAAASGSDFAARVAPMPVWGTWFVVTGSLALLSSRWPPASEKWGYSVLSGTSAGWSALYALGVVIDGHHSLTAALVWALITIMWVAIAGLENPQERIVDDERRA